MIGLEWLLEIPRNGQICIASSEGLSQTVLFRILTRDKKPIGLKYLISETLPMCVVITTERC